MQNAPNLNLAKFLQNSDDDLFFEDDDFQDFEYDREIDSLLDRTDLDETDDFVGDEIKFKGGSN
jgi:hypothetical protein